MRLNQFPNRVLAGLILSVAASLACNDAKQSATAATPDGGKIPITTSSEEAKKEFVQGRDLFERLLATILYSTLTKRCRLIRRLPRQNWPGPMPLQPPRNSSAI